MVVAGNETTTKLLGNARIRPASTPTSWRRCSTTATPEIPPWIEETLRYDTSSQMLARTVAGDVDAATARRCPTATSCCCCPARPTATSGCSPTRRVRHRPRHGRKLVSFGGGRHFCLGANLARLEARVALTELVERVRGYEVDEASAVRVHSINVRGFAHLPERDGPLR